MSSLLDLKFTQYVLNTETETEMKGVINVLFSSLHASTIGQIRKYVVHFYMNQKTGKIGRAICFELCRKTDENTPRKVSCLSVEFNDGKPVSYRFSFDGVYHLVFLRGSLPESDENLDYWTEFAFSPTWETTDKDAYDNLDVEWKHLASNTAKYGLRGFYAWIKRYID